MSQISESPKWWAAKVNVIALIATILIVYSGVKLLSFLPGQYYFSFSKVIDSENSSAFLIRPPGLYYGKYCSLLREKGYIEKYVDFERDCPKAMPVVGEAAATPVAPDNDFTPAAPDGLDVGGAAAPASPTLDETAEPQLEEAYVEDDRVEASPEERAEIAAAINEAGRFNFFVALFFKLLPPFIGGFLVAYIWPEDAEIAAPLGSVATALLLCLPVIVLWDRVVTDDWSHAENLFYLLYLMYILLYFYTSRLGVSLARVAAKYKIIRMKWETELDWGKILSNLAGTAITSVVTFIVSNYVTAGN